jgi:hypothetical protein
LDGPSNTFFCARSGAHLDGSLASAFHIGLGQAELPGDLRELDADLERGANSVQLSWRQMVDGPFDLAQGLNRLGGPTAVSHPFGEHCRLQSVELPIVELLERLRRG